MLNCIQHQGLTSDLRRVCKGHLGVFCPQPMVRGILRLLGTCYPIASAPLKAPSWEGGSACLVTCLSGRSMLTVMVPCSSPVILWRAKCYLVLTSPVLGAVFCTQLVSSEYYVVSFVGPVAISDHLSAWVVPIHDLKYSK